MMEINKELFLDNKDFISEIFGPLDKNIKFINKELGVNIYLKEDEIYISGQKILIELAEEVVNALIEYIKKEGSISISQIRKVINMIKDRATKAGRAVLKRRQAKGRARIAL